MRGRGHDRLTSIVPQLWDRGLLDKDCLLHIYYFSWTVLDTHIPWVKRSKYFEQSWISYMNFRRFGQTTVDNSLRIVYETFRLVNIYMVFCGHNMCDVCTITPSWCALHVMLKGDFGTWCTHHKWNPKFDLLHDYISCNKPNWQCMVKNHMACDCAHPCPKFEVIWIMLGKLMANK